MGFCGQCEFKLGSEAQLKLTVVMMAHGEEECTSQQGTHLQIRSVAKDCQKDLNYSWVCGIRNPMLLVFK